MAKIRQDAWSHEDDLLLAETVLRHVREGSTQLNAFEEVGDNLNRTSAACGFRWNAEVRKKYDSAMDLAKRQRKERKRAMIIKPDKIADESLITFQNNYDSNHSSLAIEETPVSISFDDVIHFLTTIKNDFHMSTQSKRALDQTKNENEHLIEQVNGLENQLAKTEKKLASIQEDYQVFIQIMERARKMTVFDDQGSLKSPGFRMDKNGNLEQLAQGLNP